MIPFAKPYIGQEEIDAVTEILKSGNLACGSKVKEFEEKFAEYVGAKYAVAFNGCTNALRSAIDVLEFPGYIHVPAITYTATASVVVDAGYTPVFMDVGKDLLVSSILPDIAVHLAGNRYLGFAPIYDSAHRIEKDDVKGSESIWCYSFYATKNMTTGYGGMACTNNQEHYDKLKIIQDDGRVKAKPTYSVEMAVGGRDMNDIAAAIGLEQLKKLPWMTERRNEIVANYNKLLGLSRTGNHLYPILVSNREKFIADMALAGIQCSIHFKPLHLEPAYKPYYQHSLPNAEYLGEKLVSIPLFPEMTYDQTKFIAETALKTGLLINE